MKRVTLIRTDSSNEGTFGRLVVDGLVFFTGELPWKDNESNVSAIPAGLYGCAWSYSPHFKRNTYHINGVPGRAGVLIHPANLMGSVDDGYRSQLNGCVALGEKLGWMDGQKAILLSAPAVRRFENYMNKESFILEVIDVNS